MHSSICSFFVKILKNLAEYFPHSILGKVFYAIFDFIGLVVSGSVIGKCFETKRDSELVLKESIFGKIILLPFTICEFIAKKLSSLYKDVRSGSVILYIIDNWNLISIRIYGAALCSFGIIFALLRLVTGSGTLIVLAASLFIAIVGGVFILINRSLKSLFKGSFILKSIGGLFYENASNEHSRLFLEDDHIHMKGTVAFAVIGAILAVFAILLTPVDFIGAICGVLFVIVVFKYFHVGVFITTAVSPVLPTMVLAGLSMLCAASFLLKLMRDKNLKFLCSPLYGLAAIFALSYFIGTLNSFAFMSSVKIFMLHICFIIFYVVLYNSLGNDKSYKAITSTFVLIGGLVALYGVIQNFLGITGTESWVDSNMFEDIKLRVFSTFDNPNVLGEYLVLLIPLAMAFVLRSEKTLHKLLYLCVLGVMCVCLVFTWSRGAWLGVMLAVVVFLVMTDKRWTLCGIVIIFVIPFIPMLLSSDSAIIGRFASIGNMEDSSTAYRVSIWMSSIKIIKDYWFSGIGPGSEAFTLIYNNYSASGADFALHSHNLYLQLLTELGISGIITFILLMFKFFKGAVQKNLTSNNKDLRSSIVVASASGILGLLLQGLTDYIWYNYKLLLIFWIVIAIGTASAKFPGSKKGGSA